jgi:hypothetical protein
MEMGRFEGQGKQCLESPHPHRPFKQRSKYSGQNHGADVLVRRRGFRDSLAFLQPFIEGINVAWAHAV